MKVHLVTLPNSDHHQSLQPFSETLKVSTEGIADDRNIVVAAHLLGSVELPSDWIIFNTEMVGEGYGAAPEYLKMLQRYEVWDYSTLNIEKLKTLGIEAKFCPIGFNEVLTKSTIVDSPIKQDIDVLFYGSVNERRKKVLEELAKECKLEALFNVYGKERDAYIARSKVVLNFHFYETAIFEIFRCAYLLANKKCVVSEIGKDQRIEMPYIGGIAFCGYEKIVEKCLWYLANPDARRIKEQTGYEIIKHRRQEDFVRDVLN